MAGGVATLDHGFKHLISEAAMRSLLLFFLGVPIPIIILIALFVH